MIEGVEEFGLKSRGDIMLVAVVGDMVAYPAAERDRIWVTLARLEMMEGFSRVTKMARGRDPWLKAGDVGPSR